MTESVTPLRNTLGVSREPIEIVLEWLSTATTRPVASHLVPGASIEERRALAALGGLVGQALETSGDPSDPRVVRTWFQTPVAADVRVVAAFRRLCSSNTDGLADLYSTLVQPTNRRSLGTFFTQPTEVRWMISRWKETERPPSTVVDVGAGVGAFTSAALDAWRKAEVFAVDVNPVTLGLLVAQMRLASAPQPESRLTPVLGDYVAWSRRAWADLSPGRLVLGNPPYTRLQLLPEASRKRLHRAAGGLCGTRANLSSLIVASTLRLLGPADGMCLLLPAQWLESDYATGLRSAIWQLRDRRVEMRLFESALFPDARVDAVALLVGTHQRGVGAFATTTDGATFTDHSRTGEAPREWRHLFAGAIATPKGRAASVPAARLADFAVVRRGTATGSNPWLLLSEDERKEWSLPLKAVHPLAHRLRDFEGSIDHERVSKLSAHAKRWVLSAGKRERESSEALNTFLSKAESEGVHEGLLCSRRPTWYDLRSELVIPDLVVGPVSQRTLRVVANPAGAAIVNNLYGISWRPETSPRMRASIASWLTRPWRASPWLTSPATRPKACGRSRSALRSNCPIRFVEGLVPPAYGDGRPFTRNSKQSVMSGRTPNDHDPRRRAGSGDVIRADPAGYFADILLDVVNNDQDHDVVRSIAERDIRLIPG